MAQIEGLTISKSYQLAVLAEHGVLITVGEY